MIETLASVLGVAMDFAADHTFSIWDAIILSASSAAGCRLTEDLQNGFSWSGVQRDQSLGSEEDELLAGLG